MNRTMTLGLLSSLALGTAACAGMSDDKPMAPQPTKPIDAAQFYTGRWYEIARTPMKLTDGCVSGTTDYYKGEDGQLIDRDACRSGTPEGKEKVFAGPVTILNPGENNKVSVRYTVFGVFPVSKTYWMLDHSDDYRWFIVSSPSFKNVSIFTRAARPSPDEVKQIAARVQGFGYDVTKLEYPTQFPAGEGEPTPH